MTDLSRTELEKTKAWLEGFFHIDTRDAHHLGALIEMALRTEAAESALSTYRLENGCTRGQRGTSQFCTLVVGKDARIAELERLTTPREITDAMIESAIVAYYALEADQPRPDGLYYDDMRKALEAALFHYLPLPSNPEGR